MAIAFRSSSSDFATLGLPAELTVTKPSGTTTNDILLALVYNLGGANSNIVITPPAGWAREIEINHTNNNEKVNLFYKRASGSEPNDYTWKATVFTEGGTPYGCAWAIIIGCYSGAIIGGDPIDISSGKEIDNSLDYTTDSINTNFANEFIISFIAALKDTTGFGVTFSDQTERAEQNLSDRGTAFGDNLQAAIGASGTKSITISGSGTSDGFSIILALRPEAIVYQPKFGGFILPGCVETIKWDVSARVDPIQVPRRDGVLVTEAPVLTSRRVTIGGTFQGNTLESVRNDIHNIRGNLKRHDVAATTDVVGPNETGLPTGRHRLFIWDDKFIMCYNQDFTTEIVEGASGYEIRYTAIFIADDPFWYSTSVQTQSIGPINTPPVTISAADVDYGVVGRDDRPAGMIYPVIKITDAQNYTKIKLTYPTTALGSNMKGFFVQIGDGVASLGSGTYTFDMGNFQILKDPATDMIDKLTTDSRFWSLEQPVNVGASPNPGLVTIDWLPAGTPMTAEIHWRPKYY